MKHRTHTYLLKLSDKSNSKKAKNKFIAVLFMLVFMLVAAASQAQTPAYAKLTESGAIVLPTEKPLNGTYLIDMSSFHFKSDEEMIHFLSTKNNDLYALRARTAQREGVLIIQTNSKPDWKLKNWNDYFITEAISRPLRK